MRVVFQRIGLNGFPGNPDDRKIRASGMLLKDMRAGFAVQVHGLDFRPARDFRYAQIAKDLPDFVLIRNS